MTLEPTLLLLVRVLLGVMVGVLVWFVGGV
jgi:hypothetical protein